MRVNNDPWPAVAYAVSILASIGLLFIVIAYVYSSATTPATTKPTESGVSRHTLVLAVWYDAKLGLKRLQDSLDEREATPLEIEWVAIAVEMLPEIKPEAQAFADQPDTTRLTAVYETTVKAAEQYLDETGNLG